MAIKTEKSLVLRDSLFFVVDILRGTKGLDLAKAKMIARRIDGFKDVEVARREILRIAREEMGLESPPE